MTTIKKFMKKRELKIPALESQVVKVLIDPITQQIGLSSKEPMFKTPEGKEFLSVVFKQLSHQLLEESKSPKA